jgi:HEAT repeat protein
MLKTQLKETLLAGVEQEAALIAVLGSDASQKEKADACRELAHLGSKASIAPLAALLSDEKLAHMARYGLETNPDPAVDEALREALGKLKGRLLVGVIGSVGRRRDSQAVEKLVQFLKDSDPEVAQAAARSLGRIGTSSAAQAVQAALDETPEGNQVAYCEGLFRCAETLAATGKFDAALAIYDRLAEAKLPHQVRAGALRGSILNNKKEGLKLLLGALRGEDFAMAAAAVRTSHEMPGGDVTKALADEVAKLSVDKQIIVIQALGTRRDAAAVPALMAAAKEGDKEARLAAIRALPEIGDAKAVSLLKELSSDPDADIAKAARRSANPLEED